MNYDLVGAVRGHPQQRAAYNGCEDRIWVGQRVRGEVEQLRLAGLRRLGEETVGQPAGEKSYCYETADEVETHLHGVYPHDRADAAYVSVDNGHYGDHRDDLPVAGVHSVAVEDHFNWNCGCEQSDAICE